MSETRALLRTEAPIVVDSGDVLAEESQSQRKRFPAPFYDPTTNKLMKDPVVAPGGITHERSSWEAICQERAKQEGGVVSAPAYDNRALKQVIEETLVKSNDYRRSSRRLLLKAQESLKSSMTKLASNSVLPSDDPKVLSEAYYCPITMSLLKHPVIAPGGYTYEKEAIDRWIDENQVSPLTRMPLPSKKLLYPNLALKEMLQLEADKNEDDPSVRDLKLALVQEEDDEEEQKQQEAYTGPTTLEEWEALHQQRRQSNAQTGVVGWGFLLVLLLVILLVIAVALLLGWLPALLITCGCCDGDALQQQDEDDEEEPQGSDGVPAPAVQ